MECTVPSRATPHERLQLDLMAAGLRMWAARGQPHALAGALHGLADYCTSTLLPHLDHDERWLREGHGCPEGHLLAEAMRAEIRTMAGVIDELSSTTEACEAMALTRVLHSFLAAHDHHENLLRRRIERPSDGASVTQRSSRQTWNRSRVASPNARSDHRPA